MNIRDRQVSFAKEVLLLTLAHYPTDWPRWMVSGSSPPEPAPEDRVLLVLSDQLPAAVAAAPPLHPPPPRCLAYPSLGPHFHCRSPRIRCRPPILKQNGF